MRKLLVTDLDGTLINNDKRDSNNIESVKKMKQFNNIVAVATGRPYNGVKFLVEENELKIDYYILLNGALLIDEDETVIEHKEIKNNIVKEIVKEYSNEQFKISLETGFDTYIINGNGENLPYDTKKIESIKDIEDKCISLISIYYGNSDDYIEKLEKIKQYLNCKYNSNITAYRNCRYIDIVPKGCSKGNGVKQLEDIFKIDCKDIYTIGDSFNDISMFDNKYNTFTFDDSEVAVKLKVKNIVSTVSECIEKYIIK